jgi:phage tail-like protein
MISINGIPERINPFHGYKFRINLGFSSQIAGFSKCSGLGSEFEVFKIREGHQIYEKKFPGYMSFPSVVLERGLSIDRTLQRWHEQISRISLMGNLGPDPFGEPDAGSDIRQDVNISLYQRDSDTPVFVWTLVQAWPSKLEDGELDASTSGILIERCELTHEHLKRKLLSSNFTAKELAGFMVKR